MRFYRSFVRLLPLRKVDRNMKEERIVKGLGLLSVTIMVSCVLLIGVLAVLGLAGSTDPTMTDTPLPTETKTPQTVTPPADCSASFPVFCVSDATATAEAAQMLMPTQDLITCPGDPSCVSPLPAPQPTPTAYGTPIWWNHMPPPVSCQVFTEFCESLATQDAQTATAEW